MPTRHFAEFLVTVYVLILIPGPSVLFTVSRGVALGRRAALATVAGNAIGMALQGAGGDRHRLDRGQLGRGVHGAEADRRGVSRVPRASGTFASVRRWPRCSTRRGRRAKSLRRIVREGFFVGATNPKGVIIFTAVLPQFIDRSQGHVTLQLATARRDLRGDRAAVRRHLGDRLGDRAQLAGPLDSPAGADDRGWAGVMLVGARRRARGDRPQELSGGGSAARGAAPGCSCTAAGRRRSRCCSSTRAARVGQARRRRLVDPQGRVRGRGGPAGRRAPRVRRGARERAARRRPTTSARSARRAARSSMAGRSRATST